MTKAMLDTEADVRSLWQMLQVRRPAGSKTERKFIKEFLAPLGLQTDQIGNLWKRIGDDPIMWSCHTDTVHKEGGKQKIRIKDGVIELDPSSKSNCLGADDTAGIWLMREMILAERPGLYIFHRAEECGGLGSSHLVKHEKEIVHGIECAIAFDRRGTTNVITHQGMGRCCSDDFGRSLAAALNTETNGMKYAICSDGIFTDTANYTDLIGECTNLSVGYYSEHTQKECLNFGHLLLMREQLMRVSLHQLTLSRKAGEVDPEDWSAYYNWRYGNDAPYRTATTTHKSNRPLKKAWDFFEEEEGELDNLDLYSLCREYPDAIADFLEHYGVDEVELRNHVMETYGLRRTRYLK